MALEGTAENIDFLISLLNEETDLPTAKVIDYALSFVNRQPGIDRLEYHLFHGS